MNFNKSANNASLTRPQHGPSYDQTLKLPELISRDCQHHGSGLHYDNIVVIYLYVKGLSKQGQITTLTGSP